MTSVSNPAIVDRLLPIGPLCRAFSFLSIFCIQINKNYHNPVKF